MAAMSRTAVPSILAALLLCVPADGADFQLFTGPRTAVRASASADDAGSRGAEAGASDETAAASAESDDEAPASVEAERSPRRSDLPRLDVLFPEGELDLRVSRLANKVFFEGQMKYNFVEGDITAFLRYRYYGFERTYQITAFDSVGFDDIEELDDEFERVRGFLVLTEWPLDYHRRTFLLAEVDRLISNKPELRFDTNRTNTFLRLGYQLGTPDDPRSNAIVGEERAEVRRLFTAFRKIGPGGSGLTAAATWSLDTGPGDFHYLKIEAETLKRFELPGENFLVGRIHGGTFAVKEEAPVEEGEERPPFARYRIPRSVLFRLDGSDNLKGVSERVRGTEQLYGTLEMFYPWFVGEEHHALWLDWQTWYWVLYAGVGTTGFDREVYTDWDRYYPDLGLGFEASFALKRHTFFLSGIVARALQGEGEIEASLSLKSYH